MRLADLRPRWLSVGSRRTGLVFQCPHCQNQWLTVFFEPTAWAKSDGEYYATETQVGQVRAALGNGVEGCDFVGVRDDIAWGHTGDTFETLTITPSIDASASGHWHGFISNGMIQ